MPTKYHTLFYVMKLKTLKTITRDIKIVTFQFVILFQSEASSPESSPVLSRRTTTRTRTVEVTQSKGGSTSRKPARKFRLPSLSMPGFVKIMYYNIPMMILSFCLLIIFLSFVFESKLKF